MKKILSTILILIASGILVAQEIDTLQFSEWLDANSINLGVKSKFEDDRLLEILSDKSVIGLGECVHGSSTINNLRFDIAKELIEKGGFNTVAFEMSFNTGLKINRYLQDGSGDIKAILKESHFFLNSEGMLEFIFWMREQNISGRHQLNAYGFDIQSNIDLVDDISSYYIKQDSLAHKYATALLKIFGEQDMSSFAKYPDDIKDSTLNLVEKLQAKHENNKKRYILNSSFVEYEYLMMRLKVLSNYLGHLNSGYSQSLKMRDSCNAEIIEWIKDFEGENSKLILLAHNGHLAGALRFTPRIRTLSTDGFYEDYPKELLTGYYLRKAFGDKYYFIGTQFGSGYFMGYDPENKFTMSKLRVDLPEPGSFTYLLGLSSKKRYFINFEFSRSTPRPVINYICSLQSFYEIGAAYDFKYSKARLIDYFDAIIYVDEIEASHLLD